MATTKPVAYHLPPTIYHLPLLVIVGPTASGKTSLAIDIAQKFNGEIICADSRSIYKGADIGTAKPSQAEQAIVRHWGLDLVEPGDYFSVADFKSYADQKIIEIRSRGHLPLLVGGTGLYIDAVIFDYQFGLPADNKLRSLLQHMTIKELHDYCNKNNVIIPENSKNRRYLIRSIENKDTQPSRMDIPLDQTIVVGISTDKDILRSRIIERSDQILADGVIDEAILLGNRYGWDSEAMKSNIYPLIHSYIDGDMSIDDVKNKFITLDWRLAKRQLTWLNRNRFIHWLSLDDAKIYLSDRLANYRQP
jgi:tRNA dimethylallyltransferase